jgi:aryl-alcohol dehydrogenase-like predicted oxidoreductase
MDFNPLGQTGLNVSRLGAGLSEIGSELTLAQEDTARQLLNAALDGGINFLDTSACYGISEDLIGRTIAHRRADYLLATKCGHRWEGYTGQPWTAQIVRDSIDRSLTRMRTDYLDLVQLHSCETTVLEQGEVIQALLDAKQAGKTRFIGYSGDNEAAQWAVASGPFDTLQTSFNLVDQHARTRLFPEARNRGMGIIAKRPIANGVWAAPASPSHYADQYFERAQKMLDLGSIPHAPENPVLLALGFTLAHPEVDTAIVGTQNPQHMENNLNWLANELPIAPEAVRELWSRFDQLGKNWIQLK